VATVWGEIISRTFQGLSNTLTNFFQTYSITVFSTWHSFYHIKSVSNTDVHNTAHSSPMTATFVYMTGITDYFGIQALWRTSYAKFQNFLNLPKRTFQGPEKMKINFQELSSTFKEECPPCTPMGKGLLTCKIRLGKISPEFQMDVPRGCINTWRTQINWLTHVHLKNSYQKACVCVCACVCMWVRDCYFYYPPKASVGKHS